MVFHVLTTGSGLKDRDLLNVTQTVTAYCYCEVVTRSHHPWRERSILQVVAQGVAIPECGLLRDFAWDFAAIACCGRAEARGLTFSNPGHM